MDLKLLKEQIVKSLKVKVITDNKIEIYSDLTVRIPKTSGSNGIPERNFLPLKPILKKK